jgi:hypothetical protein
MIQSYVMLPYNTGRYIVNDYYAECIRCNASITQQTYKVFF